MTRCACNHLPEQHDGACRECLCPNYDPDAGWVDVEVQDRWPVKMPPHRAYRPGWEHWEAARLSTMFHHLRPGDVLFDVGSEEGDLSALFASWGCRVALIEGNRRAWPWIRQTFEENGLEPAAWWWGFAADRTWSVDDAHRLGWSDWPDCSFDEPTAEHGFITIHEYAEQVPGKTIDDLVDVFHFAPDAITIDVEGAELKVLKGARRTLELVRPKVFVSVHPEFMADQGDDAQELRDYLTGLGYEGTFLATDHEVHEMWLWPSTAA